MFDFAQSMVGTGLGQPDDSGSLPYMTPGTQSCDSFLIPPLYYSSSSSTPDGSPASASLVTPPISDRLVRETPGDRSIQIEGVTGGTKRIRRFHRRSKNGCEHCKKRRVRCDEAKPVCGNCVKKGSKDLCVYSWDESRRSESKDSHSPTLNNRDTISTGTSGNSSTATAPYPAIDPLFPQPQASSSYQFETKTPCSVPFTDSLAFPTSGSSSIVEPIPPFNPSQPTFPPFAGSAPTTTRPDLLTPLQTRPPDGIEEISRVPGTFDDDPASTLFSPTTENMLNLLFGVPQTPPLPHLNWPEEGDSSHLSVQSCDKNGQQHQQVDCSGWCTTSEGIVAKVTNNQIALKNQRSGVNQDAFAAELYRRNAILNALIRQASILQQPNELATYFPSIEQRSQFCHFLYETANDLIVVPVAHAVNPWVTHLTHLALGRAAGHEVLHDAFRYGLLSLSSFDMGLRIRRGIRTPGYNAMYATSMEQRDTAIRLLQVAKSLKLYVWDVTGADLLLATVTALAIRDRLAGEQDFQNPLNLGISVITEQGGPAAFIAKSDTAVRRFLVEQMACLEILGILTTWDPPRLLVGDMKWFDDSNAFSSDDHLISVYGWNRQTIMLTAEIMTMTDEIKEVVTMRTTYRETSYPAIKSALDGRLAHLEAQYATLSRKAEEIRRKNLDTPLHPRVALGTCIQHACMDLLLVGPPDDDSLLPVAEAKARIILDLCEKSMSQGMYTGMLFPLTWAASCLNSPDQVRLQGLLRALKPHYHVDPALMDNLVEMDWSEMNMDCDKWEQVMRDKGWFAPLF